jgi:hypothetical protein
LCDVRAGRRGNGWPEIGQRQAITPEEREEELSSARALRPNGSSSRSRAGVGKTRKARWIARLDQWAPLTRGKADQDGIVESAVPAHAVDMGISCHILEVMEMDRSCDRLALAEPAISGLAALGQDGEPGGSRPAPTGSNGS